jgi:hypothetical protein
VYIQPQSVRTETYGAARHEEANGRNPLPFGWGNKLEAASVRRRLLDVTDDQNIERTRSGHRFEAELLLEGFGEGGSRNIGAGMGVAGWGSMGTNSMAKSKLPVRAVSLTTGPSPPLSISVIEFTIKSTGTLRAPERILPGALVSTVSFPTSSSGRASSAGATAHVCPWRQRRRCKSKAPPSRLLPRLFRRSDRRSRAQSEP